MSENPFVGCWSYRSYYNDADLSKDSNSIMLGQGTIVIEDGPMQSLIGSIGGDGWSLDLKGAREYGTPMRTRFQGTGVVNGEKWVYDYVGYLVPDWPWGVNQVPAIVGSVIRTIPHSGSDGSIHPAGVVGSFFAPRVAD